MTIRTNPAKNAALPAVPCPASPEMPIDRCPMVISTAPVMIARRNPSERSVTQPTRSEAR